MSGNFCNNFRPRPKPLYIYKRAAKGAPRQAWRPLTAVLYCCNGILSFWFNPCLLDWLICRFLPAIYLHKEQLSQYCYAKKSSHTKWLQYEKSACHGNFLTSIHLTDFIHIQKLITGTPKLIRSIIPAFFVWTEPHLQFL